MNYQIRPYDESDANPWDHFVSGALQGTFLHTRRFLSYHGDRFLDRSLVIEVDGRCVGLFPAAIDPGNPVQIVSHPGITYGGVLHNGSLRGGRMVQVLSEISRYYRSQGYSRLVYKAVPCFYHITPAHDDRYALYRIGAKRSRVDLSSAVNLHYRPRLTERRLRGLKKSIKAGVEISDCKTNLGSFWEVLSNNLRVKYGKKPTHSLDEIILLTETFPRQIRCICAHMSGRVVAGTVLFITPTAHHAQYIASNDIGQEFGALDLVFKYAIDAAVVEGKLWFDFGISTEDNGRTLNEGLYRFKSEFGGGGFLQEFYEIDLMELDHYVP